MELIETFFSFFFLSETALVPIKHKLSLCDISSIEAGRIICPLHKLIKVEDSRAIKIGIF